MADCEMECEYFQSALIKSGWYPIYHYYCNHPAWPKGSFIGKTVGRFIDRNNCKKPAWCPKTEIQNWFDELPETEL